MLHGLQRCPAVVERLNISLIELYMFIRLSAQEWESRSPGTWAVGSHWIVGCVGIEIRFVGVCCGSLLWEFVGGVWCGSLVWEDEHARFADKAEMLFVLEAQTLLAT